MNRNLKKHYIHSEINLVVFKLEAEWAKSKFKVFLVIGKPSLIQNNPSPLENQ